MASTASAQTRRFDIPPQPASSGVPEFARQAGLQMLVTEEAARGQRISAVRGEMDVRAALSRLLAGTSLRVARDTGATIVLTGPVRTAALQGPVVADAPPPPPPPPALQIAPEETTEVDEVVVTGSRIPRASIDTPTPVVTIGSADITESGDVELSETLAELPAVSSTLSETTVTGNVQNSGLSSINLRNLGDNRTLVLIDGRRTVSNSANGNRVSLNTIPSDFVDRVEVITGGTSSVYGSDAVAGVVNIITETNETGFRLGVRAGVTEEGDGQETTFTARWGARFAEDRGYFLISGSADYDEGIRARDREWAIRQVDYDYNETTGVNEFDTLYVNNGVPTSGDQPASTFPPNEFRDLSSFIPGGTFYGASSVRDRFYRGGTLVPLGPDVQTGAPVPIGTSDSGNTGYFLPNRDGYNQREQRSLIIPRDRHLLAAKLDYKLTPTTTLFGQVQYSLVETTETREPSGIGFDSTYPVVDPVTGLSTELSFGRIPCRRATGTGSGACNPFVPDEIRRDVATSGSGVAWDRRFVELGGQLTENERETLRTWFGARGKIWTDWNWETSFSYGEFTQEQVRSGEINGANLRQALDAVTVNGQIVCRNPANGCVPVNLFGEGSITPEAAQFISASLTQNATVKQEAFQAFVAGDLFELPAGPVGAAFGFDYRKDSQDLKGDLLSQFGGTTGNPVPNFGGSITAVEGYGEVTVPLIADRPFIDLLSVDASARVAEYDIEAVGTVYSYRAGAQWAPVRDLRFRAQFARAQRAPDLTELFSPPRGDFDDASDICSGVRPTSTGTIAANCLAEPGIQAALAALAAEGEPVVFDQEGSSIYSPNAGNLALQEETADTFTLGFVANPRVLPGFTLAVDYYDISIEDAITSYGNQDILIQCYDSTLAIGANPFCAEITRNPATGQISELIQREFNLAGFQTRGVDVAAQYRFDLSDRFGVPGRWNLRYDATHLLSHKFRFQGLEGLEVTDQKGDLSQGTFEYRSRASLAWEHQGLRLRWTTTYLGEILDSRFRQQQYEELVQSVPTAQYPLFLDIGAVWEHDLFASYTFDVAGVELRLAGGVNNVFNEISPFLPTGDAFSGRLTNYNGAYDVAGRRYYLGLTASF